MTSVTDGSEGVGLWGGGCCCVLATVAAMLAYEAGMRLNCEVWGFGASLALLPLPLLLLLHHLTVVNPWSVPGAVSPVAVATGRSLSRSTGNQVISSCMFLVGLSGLSGSGALLALSQRAEEEDRSCWKVEVGLVHGGGGGGGIAACSKAASLVIIGAMACCTMLAKSVTVGSSGTMWFLSPRELGCCGLAGPRSSCRGAQGGALFG